MGLANVHVSLPYFEQLHSHLMTHNRRRCRNMHLRAAYKDMKPAQMQYLHAVYATSPTVISGMISGPEVFSHYDLVLEDDQPHLRVHDEGGEQKILDQIERRFLRAMVDRMRLEATTDLDHYVNRIEGQLYLRRHQGGMSPDEQVCREAIARGALDPRFVSQLAPWNLVLYAAPPQPPRRPRRPRP